MRPVTVFSLLLLLAGCNDPVGGWCGEYRDRMYPAQKDLRFVSYFQFCDSGDVLIQLTGRRTTSSAGWDMPGEWGKWEKTTEGHAFTTHNPKYPTFDYKLMGHWNQDAGAAEYTIWDRFFPTFTHGKAFGTASRCEERYKCTPVYPDLMPRDMSGNRDR